MSYDISLYRIETKENEKASNAENFFENGRNLVAFSEQQFQGPKGETLDLWL